jgi:hypothetical protein
MGQIGGDYDNRIIENEKVLDLFAADDERAASANVRGKFAEELASDILRAGRSAELWRFALAQIKRNLSMRDGEVPAEGEALRHLA